MKEIALKLIEARKPRYTQKTMADALNVSERTYQRYEDGEFPQRGTKTIKNIDTLLGTNIYDMLYGKHDTTSKNPPADNKYVELMEDVIEGLKKDKEWLQDLVKVSLGDLRNRQMEIHAEVKGGIKTQADVIAKGDPKKIEESLVKTNTYAGEYLEAMITADSNRGAGK